MSFSGCPYPNFCFALSYNKVAVSHRLSSLDAELDEVIEEKYINRTLRLTTATEELDNRSCDQLATCDKTSEQKIKTVQRKPKVRIEDAEATADGIAKLLANQKEHQEDMGE